MAGPRDEQLQFPAKPLAPPLDLDDNCGDKSAASICFLFFWEKRFDVFEVWKISPSGDNIAPN